MILTACPNIAVESATTIADALLEQCRFDEFAGYDPFDGLNSELFKFIGGNRSRVVRVAWLQMHKRSPLNLRPLVAVPKTRNPKGIALFVLGLLERYRLSGNAEELAEAFNLGNWLLTQSVDRSTWSHHAWGYHFDWAARAFYVPRGKPNAITTCYVARALYELGAATGEETFTDAAVDSGFFLDSLHLNNAGVEYYAYIPGESAFVHNASLWSAALVAKTAVITGDAAMRERALRVARQSVSMQSADGGWVYGTLGHHGFIDGFHTGYNLEALTALKDTTGSIEFNDAIERGMDYYRRNFFLPDGTVKYYHDRVWPIDVHSVAQAIVTLLKVGTTIGDLRLADRVVGRAITSLYMVDKKRFVYQKGRWLTNRINYMRWTQAWAFYAFSVFAAAQSNGSEALHATY